MAYIHPALIIYTPLRVYRKAYGALYLPFMAYNAPMCAEQLPYASKACRSIAIHFRDLKYFCTCTKVSYSVQNIKVRCKKMYYKCGIYSDAYRIPWTAGYAVRTSGGV